VFQLQESCKKDIETAKKELLKKDIAMAYVLFRTSEACVMCDKMTCHGLKSFILSWLFIQAFAKHSTDDQLSLSVINFLYTKNGRKLTIVISRQAIKLNRLFFR